VGLSPTKMVNFGRAIEKHGRAKSKKNRATRDYFFLALYHLLKQICAPASMPRVMQGVYLAYLYSQCLPIGYSIPRARFYLQHACRLDT